MRKAFDNMQAKSRKHEEIKVLSSEEINRKIAAHLGWIMEYTPAENDHSAFYMLLDPSGHIPHFTPAKSSEQEAWDERCPDWANDVNAALELVSKEKARNERTRVDLRMHYTPSGDNWHVELGNSKGLVNVNGRSNPLATVICYAFLVMETAEEEYDWDVSPHPVRRNFNLEEREGGKTDD